MKFKLNIDVEKDTFQDIADRLTEYFKTIDNYVSTSKEVKSWLENHLEYDTSYMSGSYGGLSLNVKGIYVSFTFKTRKTGKTQKVSKLKRMELYEFDKVVFDSFRVYIRIPNFDKEKGNHKVIKNAWSHQEKSGMFKGKTFGKLTFKEAFDKGVGNISEEKSLKDLLVNSMAQPYYKTIAFVAMKSHEEGQKEFDRITIEVEKNNQELLEECLKEYTF